MPYRVLLSCRACQRNRIGYDNQFHLHSTAAFIMCTLAYFENYDFIRYIPSILFIFLSKVTSIFPKKRTLKSKTFFKKGEYCIAL